MKTAVVALLIAFALMSSDTAVAQVYARVE